MKKVVSVATGFIFSVVGVYFSWNVLFSAPALATAPDWMNGSIQVEGSHVASMGWYQDFPCSGIEGRVRVAGKVDDHACVFGAPGSLRVARYSSGGVVRYAASLPLDSTFIALEGFCFNNHRCAYSSKGDVALVSEVTGGPYFGAVIYKNFSSYLHYTPTANGGVFRFSPPSTELINRDGIPLPASAMSLSPNGRWAAIEARDFGLLRVDTTTGAVRRFSAPGSVYGRGNDPVYELAISNSGEFIATAGLRLGVVLYQIDEHCGDIPTATSTVYFSDGAARCRAHDLDRYTLFPGFVYASQPIFSEDASTLLLTVKTQHSINRYMIRPDGEHAEVGEAGSHRADYVALGDSYTSGEGETDDRQYIEGTNTARNACHVSNRSYPYLLADLWGRSGFNAACSGARVGDVLGVPGQAAGQLVRAISLSPSLLSLSIGGNDVGLITKLKACLAPGTCEWAKPGEQRFAAYREIVDFYDVLVTALTTIRHAHTGSIVAMGYPQVINKKNSSSCDALTGVLINQEERIFMHNAVTLLNDVIERAALTVGVRYIDIEDAFGEHKLCDSGQLAMNALRAGDDIAPIGFLDDMKLIGAESFHPTPFGHQKVAEKVTSKFSWETSLASVESQHTNEPPPGEYWGSQSLTDQVPKLISLEGIIRTVLDGRLLDIGVPVHTFLPNTMVRLEIHSEPTAIGEIQSREDGSLVFSGTVPDIVPIGFHSLHLYGTLASGNEGDVYVSLYIPGDESSDEAAQHQADGSVYEDVRSLTTVRDPTSYVFATAYTHSTALPIGHAGAQPKVLGKASIVVPEDRPYVRFSWLALLIVGVALTIAAFIVLYCTKQRRG